MKKQKNSKRKRNIILSVCITVVLLLFWLAASLFFVRQTSFTVLDVPNKVDVLLRPSGKLLKGDVYRGKFTATENYLGIVKIRFKELLKVDYKGEDVLQFRIKEEKDKNWYYLNNYRSGTVENNLTFPFGFPVIDSSQGKTYVFEVESLLGTNTNAVTMDQNRTVYTGHQMSKKEIFGSKKRIVIFLYKKTITSFTNFDFILQSTLFLLPLALFLLLKFIYKKYVWRRFAELIFVATIVIDVFLFKEVYVGVLFFGLILWLFSIFLHKLDYTVSFFLAFVLIALWLLLMSMHISANYSKFNIWVYSLLLYGVVQLVIEQKKGRKHRLSYKEYLSVFRYGK